MKEMFFPSMSFVNWLLVFCVCDETRFMIFRRLREPNFCMTSHQSIVVSLSAVSRTYNVPQRWILSAGVLREWREPVPDRHGRRNDQLRLLEEFCEESLQLGQRHHCMLRYATGWSVCVCGGGGGHAFFFSDWSGVTAVYQPSSW